MLRKLAILATGGVIAFLLITLVSGFLGFGQDASRKPIVVDPSRIPEHFEKPDTTGNRIPRPGEGAGGWIQRTDPASGRLVQEFRYEKLEPLTEGEFRVSKPQARFHLALNRVIDIRANSGTIVAPQNIPQQGRFEDGVVVRLYETKKNEKLNLGDDSTDIVAVIHLQDATFNSQLGKLDSTGDVLLEGRNAEFRGRGLVLVYNEPQQRIDYLEVTQGQYLKYTPPAETQDSGAATSKTGTDTAAGTAEKPADGGKTKDDGRVQFYQVQFDRSVHVRSAGRSIDADDLLGFFAFNRRSNIARTQSAAGAEQMDDSTLLAGAGTNATGMALGQAKAEAKAGTVAGVKGKVGDGPQEVVMTWAGKMVVTPVATRPERLRNDQDLMLTFRGRPVTMRSENEDTMTCSTAEYHEYQREVSAIGSGEFPLMIESPALGEVTASSLSLRLSDQVGKLEGAGYIKSKAENAATPGQGNAAAAAAATTNDVVVVAAGGTEGDAKAVVKVADNRGLPAGFSIRWTDHVDLLLTQTKEKPSGLKTAQFVGDVEVNDPRFTMSGEKLAVHFEPDRKGKSRRFSSVDASGNVTAKSEDGRIAAQTLHLDTVEAANGKIHPTVLVASGDVRINDKTQSISAGALSAMFAEKAATGRGATKAGGAAGTKIDVTQLTATDHVKLKLEDGTEAEADQLEADNTTGIATLTGEPVVVGKEGAALRVAKLHLNRAKEVATAEGKGRFDYEQVAGDAKTRSEDVAAGTASGKPQAANPLTRKMHVSWSNGMVFDQGANLLTVTGDVTAEQSDRLEEENKLTADAVELEMMDRQTAKKQGVELKGRSLLKRMDAKGDVVLLSSRWLDGKREELEARMLLKGPGITFDNAREIAKVQGAGSMLLEDYRKRGAGDTDTSGAAVQMNGRGATLFTWTRWMTMDGSKTSVVMDGNVEMTHRPSEKSPVVQMQTSRLTAEMKGIGGIEALAASKTKKLDIDHIEAEGGVQLRDDKRLISAQHLYYDGATQTATLEAQAGRRVNVIQLDEPKPIRAQRIIWDLKKDRLEIEQPGY